MASKAKKAPAKGKKVEPKTRVRGKIDRGGRRWYTDDERIGFLAMLDANAGNVAQTAKQAGIPMQTLHAWKSGARCPEALLLRNEKKGDLANAVEELAWLFASEIPRKVEKAPLNHLTAGLGIMVEKMKLLRGEHTSYGRTDNTNQNLTVDLSKLTEHERTLFLALSARVCGSTPADAPDPGPTAGRDPAGTGAQVPRALPAVLG